MGKMKDWLIDLEQAGGTTSMTEEEQFRCVMGYLKYIDENMTNYESRPSCPYASEPIDFDQTEDLPF